METTLGGPRRDFPTTRWSLLLDAGDSAERARHLEALARGYWKPVYCYVRGAWGKSDADAQDLTQAFFVRMLEADFLADVDPRRGRFRHFLKACLRHFLMERKRHDGRQKRGGGAAVAPLTGVDPAAPDGDPARAFDRQWTETLVESALQQLQEQLSAEDRTLSYQLLVARDIEGDGAGYQALAERFGASRQTVKSQIHYARQALTRLIVEAVREYCGSEREVQQELEDLLL